MEIDNYDEIYKIDTNIEIDIDSRFYNLTKYPFNNLDEDTKQSTIKLIQNNIDNIMNLNNPTDFDNMHYKLISIDKVKHDILLYEFFNGKPEMICKTMDDVCNLLLAELQRYQWIVGGYHIEDIEWFRSDCDARFTTNDGSIIIYNTIEEQYNNNDLNLFLKIIEHRVSQMILNESDVSISFVVEYDKPNEISWIKFFIKNL